MRLLSRWWVTPYGVAMDTRVESENADSVPVRGDDGVRGRGEIWLLRHGRTEWSNTGRHTGRTDLPLDEVGRQQAEALAAMLRGRSFDAVLVSPLDRARQTARLAGLSDEDLDDDLVEWNYGAWEGRTTAEIRAELGEPEWTIWSAPIPDGEQPEDVQIRADRVLRRMRPVVAAGGSVALVAHGHLLRILTAGWLGLPARAGRLWALEPATISVLGFEHEQQVIIRWNSRC